MRILLILPPVELQAIDSTRALRLSAARFANVGFVSVAAPQVTLEYYRNQFADQQVSVFDVEPDGNTYDIFIFVEGYDGQVCPPGPHNFFLANPEHQRTYWFLLGSRLKLVQPATYDAFEFPHVDSHAFIRLSGRKHEFVNFPYGPLYSDVEVGSVNEFGFRIPQDYKHLAQRESNHKLVVVFGGSAAFGFYCSSEEMFATRLEGKLNASLSSVGSDLRFSVLNFGMHDNVVMQEMLTYMLFVYELKPDIVLAHDGHNDIYYGLQNDPYLLNNFDLIYQRYSEEWSKILHKTSDMRTPELYSITVGSQELNFPQNVIRVYIKRKRQFERIVHSHGGTFVWGIQPLHCSKGKLSSRELLRYRQAERGKHQSPAQKKFLRCLYYAYNQLSEELSHQPDILLADFNRYFQIFDDNAELLWDHCHTSPDGEEVIAEYYLKMITRMIEEGAFGTNRSTTSLGERT